MVAVSVVINGSHRALLGVAGVPRPYENAHPLGLTQGPRHRPTVGSYGGSFLMIEVPLYEDEIGEGLYFVPGMVCICVRPRDCLVAWLPLPSQVALL